MKVETNESGDVVIKEDDSANVEQTVETVLEAAQEIAEAIDDARKEGEASEAEISHVATVAVVTLETVNARCDGIERSLARLIEICEEIQGAQIVAEIQQEEIAQEILDDSTPPDNTSNVESEITIEQNDGVIAVETPSAPEAPEARKTKQRKWV